MSFSICFYFYEIVKSQDNKQLLNELEYKIIDISKENIKTLNENTDLWRYQGFGDIIFIRKLKKKYIGKTLSMLIDTSKKVLLKFYEELTSIISIIREDRMNIIEKTCNSDLRLENSNPYCMVLKDIPQQISCDITYKPKIVTTEAIISEIYNTRSFCEEDIFVILCELVTKIKEFYHMLQITN